MESITIKALLEFSIRECYLLKKYGYRWIHATFGRVSPSRARCYFWRRFMREIFHAWQDKSVHTTSWILSVRADCNNKYRLMTRHWNAWRRYIQVCRDKKGQVATADRFRCKLYARQIFPVWKEFVLNRQTRKNRLDMAVEFNLTNLLSRSFHTWIDELNRMREFHSLETTALSLWSSGVQKRLWRVWVERIQERYERNRLFEFAGITYKNKLVKMCFEKLKLYVRQKREKRALNWNIRQDYEKRVMTKYLRRWLVRRWKEMNIREKQRQIEKLALQVRLRRFWLAWLDYASQCREEKERETVGKKFRIRALKSRGWNAILNAHRNRRVTEWKSQVALQLWVLWRYRHAWSRWEERMEVRMELKQEPVSRIARQHYYKVIAARAFVAFKSYRLVKKSKKLRYKVGEDYYEKILKLKSLSALKRYVLRKNAERERSLLSSRLQREIFLNRFFFVWVGKLEQQREVNDLMERAEYYHASVSVRTFFSQWKEKFTETKRERMRIVTAVMSYNFGLQKKIFIVWKRFVMSCQKQKEAKNLARREYQIKIVRKCFARMKLIHGRNEFIRRRCRRLVSALDMANVRKTFKAWKKFILMLREEKDVMLMAENHWKINVQKNVLRGWLHNVALMKMRKERNRTATAFWHSCITHRHFHIWKSTQLIMVEQGVYESELVTKVAAIIQRGCLSRCFWGWLVLKDKSVIKRYTRMKADRTYSNSLMKRSLSQWKLTILQKRKLLLGYQHAIWFHRSSLLARTYTQWRLQLNSQRYYNHRRTLALWNWSRVLMGKVFDALRSNARECRRKRLRYEAAADQFRDRVVMKGILQIIHSGSAMLAAEETSVLREIERNTKYSWGCALKCAKIWRQKTQERKSKREITYVSRLGLAVPDLGANLGRQFPTGLEDFWSQITDFTIKTRSLPAPRIPEGLKLKWNPVTCNTDKDPSPPDHITSIPEECTTSSHEVKPTSSIPEENNDSMLRISQSDIKLLQDTKQQLMQVFESKILLKSLKERLTEPYTGSQDMSETEELSDIRNRVHEIEEQIQILQPTIKYNISQLSQCFKLPTQFQEFSS